MPFGKYRDFQQCVAANRGKDNPEGYCAAVHKKITGQWPGETVAGAIRRSARNRGESPKKGR